MSTSFEAPRAPAPPDALTEHAARRTLRAGELVASFYTSEPEPAQWIAVATIRRALAANAGSDSLRLLVGAGDSEESAIAQLSHRLGLLAARPATPTHVPSAT